MQEQKADKHFERPAFLQSLGGTEWFFLTRKKLCGFDDAQMKTKFISRILPGERGNFFLFRFVEEEKQKKTGRRIEEEKKQKN